ncbi:hypothetical protein KAR91_48865 [Candidatus Pacearchaeota archaeon]|nr:hypothetical protein [Candidatus Pacearchaeota archaeon]
MSKFKIHWLQDGNKIACGIAYMYYRLFFEETKEFDSLRPEFCCLRCLKKRQKVKKADERDITQKGKS